MSTSLVDADSLLAIDIGTINTRAILFDVVDGRYRFLASGSSPTTAGAPYLDTGEGVRRAIQEVEEISGRDLLDSEERLILPSQSEGGGIDACVATISVGAPMRVVVVGLLDDVSVQSARHLAETTYSQVIDTISLTDRRKPEERLDTIIRLQPDLVIMAGGTNEGASRSISTLLESIGLACYLLPEQQRPEVLYAGNESMAEEVKESLGQLVPLHISPNIRPALEVEQLNPAQTSLAHIYRKVQTRKILGVQELDIWTKGRILPSATAFGRVIRFFSKVYDPSKGVLGIDAGASAVTVAASFSGELKLGVYPELGIGESLARGPHLEQLGEITRWLPFDIPEDYVRDYLYNKSIHPGSLPATQEDLAIEQSIARQSIRLAIQKAAEYFPPGVAGSEAGLLPWFEPVVAAGSVLTDAPSFGQSLLMLLDSLQPTGVTTIVLDQKNLSPVLGAAADINPFLPVQVIESSTFLNLGTIISLVGNTHPGTPILRVKVDFETGNETLVEVKYGSLELIQLPIGQVANLHLQPLHRFDIGMGGAGRGGVLKVVGGALGVIIDARGRPLQLPGDSDRRRELLGKWLWTLGG